MSLAQQLLLRALVARFWREPYHDAARRAGAPSCTTASCCRISSGRISRTCSPSCAAPATPFEPEWFAPHFEFRFPLDGRRGRARRCTSSCGRRSSPGTCSARKARRGGTVRYVDSSVERLQVQVTGLTGDRYVVTCNGRALPLQPTGTQRRVRRRRALPRLAAAVVPAPDDPRPRAADVRHRRHLDGALARRLPVPRDASGRPELRAVPGEQLRGREPAAGALLRARPHARPARGAARPSAAASFRTRWTCAPDHAIATRSSDRALADRSHATTGLGALLRALRARPPATSTSCCDGAGALRPHWRTLRRHTPARSSADALDAAQARVARQLHENGVTYNVYADADGPARPWALDVLPLVVPAAEWEPLAPRPAPAGAPAERAGRRSLRRRSACSTKGSCRRRWSSGIPAFCAPVTASRPPGGVFLHQVAFDLARGARRPMVGRRHAYPGAVGRGLRAREPRRPSRGCSPTPSASCACSGSRRSSDASGDALARRAVRRRGAARRAADAGPVQRDVLRARVPGALPRLHRSSRAATSTVRDDRVFLKTLTGLRARPRHPAAPGRRLLRSARAARRLGARRARPGAGLARGPRARGERVRRGRARVARALGVPARGLRAPARRAARAAVHPHVVVRRRGRARRGAAPPAGAGHQAGIPRRAHGARLRGRSRRGRRALGGSAPGRGARPLRAPGIPAALPRAGLARRAAREPRADAARVPRRRRPRRLPRDAGRAVAHRRRGPRTWSRASAAASSKDTWVLSDAPIEPLSLLPGQLRPDGHRDLRARGVEPGRREPVLARALRRAQREQRPPAAGRALAPARGATRSPRSCSRAVIPHVPPARTAPCAGASGTAGRPTGCERRADRPTCSIAKAGFSLACNVEQTVRVAGAVRDRLSADNWRLAEPALRGLRRRPSAAGRPRRSARADRSGHRVAGRRRRPRDGAHDPGRRLALPQPRALHRAAVLRRDDGRRGRRLGRATATALLEWLLDLSDSVITYRARYMRPPEWLPGDDLLLFDRRNPDRRRFSSPSSPSRCGCCPAAASTGCREIDASRRCAGPAATSASCSRMWDASTASSEQGQNRQPRPAAEYADWVCTSGACDRHGGGKVPRWAGNHDSRARQSVRVPTRCRWVGVYSDLRQRALPLYAGAVIPARPGPQPGPC